MWIVSILSLYIQHCAVTCLLLEFVTEFMQWYGTFGSQKLPYQNVVVCVCVSTCGYIVVCQAGVGEGTDGATCKCQK